jgi:hypothetical protein
MGNQKIFIVTRIKGTPLVYTDRLLAEHEFVQAVNDAYETGYKFFSDAITHTFRHPDRSIKFSEGKLVSSINEEIKLQPASFSTSFSSIVVSDPLSLLKSKMVRPTWGRAKYRTIIRETSHGRMIYSLNGHGVVLYTRNGKAGVSADTRNMTCQLMPNRNISAIKFTDKIHTSSGYIMIMDGATFYEWDGSDMVNDKLYKVPYTMDDQIGWLRSGRVIKKNTKARESVGFVWGDGIAREYEVETHLDGNMGSLVEFNIKPIKR